MDINNLDAMKRVVHGELVVGNHDSLLLYGANVQSEIRDISKTMSEIIYSNNSSVYDVIRDVVERISSFNYAKKKPGLLSSHHALIKKYNSLLKYIDEISLSLQIEQAQQIKLGKMLDMIYDKIESSIEDVAKAIDYGESYFNSVACKENNNAEVTDWLNRLDKKIIDLKTTKTILLQNRAQIDILQKNNRELVDKIVTSVSNTIPIWRNQTSLLLGIELMDRNAKTQREVLALTEKYIAKETKRIKKQSAKNGPVNIEQFMTLNNKLSASLVELSELENESMAIRNNLKL